MDYFTKAERNASITHSRHFSPIDFHSCRFLVLCASFDLRFQKVSFHLKGISIRRRSVEQITFEKARAMRSRLIKIFQLQLTWKQILLKVITFE